MMLHFRVLALLWLGLTLAGCLTTDKSILVKDGDDQLDCLALAKEYDHAVNLRENAAARRRHIRALQKQNACAKPPKVSISIGIFKSFN